MRRKQEITSMSSQLTRCYAVNRQASHQVTLQISSLNKRLLARYQNVMNSQHLRWKNVIFSSDGYEVTDENRKNGDLVYLTADAEETVDKLENGTKYIIGGIVDKNRYKV
jgi:tRNA (guanine9-N1)-methyltransferase